MPNRQGKILSNAAESWLLDYRDVIISRSVKSHAPVVQVNDIASKLAFLYEKIRNTVDYHEDHLLRRHGTSRIMRRLATPGSKGSDIALPLVEELIRARYLPNNEITESAVDRTKHIINKYIVIYNSAVDSNYPPHELRNFFNWLMDVAACEIEEILSPAHEGKITIDAMHHVVSQDLILDGAVALPKETKEVQIYIAVLKSLMKADEMTINYYLIKYYFRNWNELSLKEADKIGPQVKNIQNVIKKNYIHPLNDKLSREFKQYAVVFWVLQDVIEKHPDTFLSIFQNPEKLYEEVRRVCKERYSHIGGKVRRAIVRSVIYIFLTKIIFGILLELPYDYFILKRLEWFSLGINAIFPPLLMATIGLSIKTPKEDNTNAILTATKQIIYNTSGEEHRVKITKPKTGIISALLKISYLIMYIVSFGLIIAGLKKLHFSPASMAIFLLFLTMVSFFSLRIRRTAAELIILKHRERFLTVIISFLFVPILRVGRWISLHSSKVNVFIFILDFIIEAPFKMFIRMFEDLVVFIKEKRDEMM